MVRRRGVCVLFDASSGVVASIELAEAGSMSSTRHQRSKASDPEMLLAGAA